MDLRRASRLGFEGCPSDGAGITVRRMVQAVSYTTDPMPVPRKGSWRERFEYIWYGVEAPKDVQPGVHSFRPSSGLRRRHAELFHNAALERGYESQFVVFRFPTSWQVSVREPGSEQPEFVRDEVERFTRWADQRSGGERKPVMGHVSLRINNEDVVIPDNMVGSAAAAFACNRLGISESGLRLRRKASQEWVGDNSPIGETLHDRDELELVAPE
jgi:hypothetical protein